MAMTALSGQVILVTGGSGFMGSRICARAVERGAIVHAASRTPHGVGVDGVRREPVDVSDHRAAEALVRRVQPDVVLHLASRVAGARDRDLVLPMLQANLVGAVNVMLAAGDVGCRRVVLAGSLEEPDPGDPDPVVQSPYAAAKGAARWYARLFHGVYGLPVVHLRVSMVYGPGQRDLKKLVPYVTLSALRGRAPELTSGARGFDWVYIDDVADAFLAAAVAAGIDGASLDIGSGKLVTGRDIASRLCALIDTGVEPIYGAVPERPLDYDRVADLAAAAELLGWRPNTTLDTGLAETVCFYRSWLDRLPAAWPAVQPP
jgi:nucleoside-diphosphate-sugar epimerase